MEIGESPWLMEEIDEIVDDALDKERRERR
jgi:hypothetical protein